MSSLLKDGWFTSRSIAPNTSTLILPVLEMIEDPTSVLSVFFDTSLKSFVLLLDVQPGHSMYTNLSDVEQTEFLLKISVISDRNDVSLTKYTNANISKSTESADSFKTESELQQNINLDTIRYGSTEKAPPVTSFALFGGINATSFLSILKNKAIGQNRPESAQVLVVVDYLRTVIMRYNYQIGVIVMPRISGSIPMAGITITWDIVAEQIASVLQIVIKQKSIPFDLHSNNQLFNPTTGNLVIIDYGRTSGLLEPGDEFLDTPTKQQILHKITTEYEILFNGLEHEYTDILYDPNNKLHRHICQYMSSVLSWIKEIEIHGNMTRFPGRYDSNPETASRMKFIGSVMTLPPDEQCRVFYNAFKKLVDSIVVSDEELTHSRIREYISEGRIIGFRGVTSGDFYCDIPHSIGSFIMHTTEPLPIPVLASFAPAFNANQNANTQTVPYTQTASYTQNPSSTSPFPTFSGFSSSGGTPMRTKSKLKSYRNISPKYVKNRSKFLTSKRKIKNNEKLGKQRKTRKTKKTKKPKKN